MFGRSCASSGTTAVNVHTTEYIGRRKTGPRENCRHSVSGVASMTRHRLTPGRSDTRRFTHSSLLIARTVLQYFFDPRKYCDSKALPWIGHIAHAASSVSMIQPESRDKSNLALNLTRGRDRATPICYNFRNRRNHCRASEAASEASVHVCRAA